MPGARQQSACGATQVLNPRTIRWWANLDATVGRGVDVVFRWPVPSEAHQQMVEVNQVAGTIVPIGSCAEELVPLPLASFRRRARGEVASCADSCHTYPRAIGLAAIGQGESERYYGARFPRSRIWQVPSACWMTTRTALSR